MKKSFKTYTILFFLLVCMAPTGHAQSSNETELLKKDIWEKERQELDYGDIKIEPEEKEEKKKDPDRPLEKKSGDGMDPALVKGIVFGLILLGVLYILYLIFGNMVFQNKKMPKNQREYSLEEIEEHLESADLDEHLKQSLNQEDYRKAIRLIYLKIIKELSIQDWIQWKKDKTNFSYVSEMRPRKEYDTFRDITCAFEIIWYGEALILEEHYLKLDPLFSQFLNQLKKS